MRRILPYALILLPLFFLNGCSKVINHYMNQLPSFDTPSFFSNSDTDSGNKTLDAFFKLYEKDAVFGASTKNYQAVLAKRKTDEGYMLDISGCNYTLKKNGPAYDRYFMGSNSKYKCLNQAAENKLVDKVKITETNANWVKLTFYNPNTNTVKYTALMEKLTRFSTVKKKTEN